MKRRTCHNTGVIIGGYHDKTRVRMDFYPPILKLSILPEKYVIKEKVDLETDEIKEETYRLESLYCKEADFTFYRHESLTIEETFLELLENYKR